MKPPVGIEGCPPLLMLGLGLGYGAVGLARRLPDEQPLVIAEASPEVFAAAASHGELAALRARPNTWVLVAPDARQITEICGDEAPVIVPHAPSLRVFPEYYASLRSSLEQAAPPRVAPGLFSRDRLRVAMVHTPYHLVEDCRAAITGLGHEGLDIAPPGPNDGHEWLERLTDGIRRSRPDFLLTINHLGFDRSGALTRRLDELGVPHVAWYVDSPTAILPDHRPLRSRLAHIAVWDRAYEAEMRALGFEQVSYLPLATSPRFFNPRRPHPVYESPVSFVGDSMTDAVGKWRERAGLSAAELDALTYTFDPARVARRGIEDHRQTAVVLRATQLRRAELLRAVADESLSVYGDKVGWREQLPGSVELRDKVAYFRELPDVYCSSDINLNATSFQMPGAPNQRVFDTAACGAFMLTDERPDLGELMEPGVEVITYGSADELREKVRYYRRRPAERRKIAEAARRRVLAEHTYEHRLAHLIEGLRERYA